MAVPSGIIIAWVLADTIPTNWSRVTTMDDRFGKGTTGSPAPNAETVTPTHIHDSATHLHDAAHNHTGTTPGTTGTGDPNCIFACVANALLTAHTHTFTIGTITGNSSTDDHGDWVAGSSNPAFYAVRWIQSNGSPTGFPDDSVAFFNDSTPPTGWGQHAASKDRFIIGCADGENTITGGATGGGGTHTHATGAHTHTAGNHTHGSVTSASQTQGAVTLGYVYWTNNILNGSTTHTHTIAAFASSGSVTSSGLSGGTSGTATYEPPFYTVLGIENTSGGDSLEEGIIVGWLGTIGNIPDEWVLCDGDVELGVPDLDGKFLKMADATSEVGDTGGTLGHSGHSSAGHTHTSAHTHSNTAAASVTVLIFPQSDGNTGGDNSIMMSTDNSHVHAASGTSSSSGTLASTSPTLSSETNTEPANRTMAWLQYQPEAGGSPAMFGSNF